MLIFKPVIIISLLTIISVLILPVLVVLGASYYKKTLL